jgi:ankyrin repeat protein
MLSVVLFSSNSAHLLATLALFYQDENPPLHLACRSGNTNLVLFLLKHGVLIGSQNKVSNSSSSTLIMILIDHQDEMTALHIACSNGNLDIISLLLDRGAAIDHRSKVLFS